MIRTDAAVTKILVRDGRARGVVLEGGEEIEGAVVASNLDPLVSVFLRLLEERELPSDFVAAMRRFRSEGHFVQDQPGAIGAAGVSGAAGRAGAAGIAQTMHICPSIEYTADERAWRS